MSRHEIKEELRQSEGDRLMKARFRSLRLDADAQAHAEGGAARHHGGRQPHPLRGGDALLALAREGRLSCSPKASIS